MTKTKFKILAVSLLFSLSFWIIDTGLGNFVFNKGTFLDLLILKIPFHALYIRLVIVGFFFLFGIFFSSTISKQQKIEGELRKSEERFREIFENSQDALYKRNLKTGRYEYMSPAITQISGYTPEKMLSLSQNEIDTHIHPEDLEKINGIRKTISESSQNHKEIFKLESRIKHKDGTYRWISDHFKLIRDADGHPSFSVASMRDITDQKKTEEALKESEKKYRTLFETMAQGVVYQDSNGTIFSANKAAEEILGLSLDQMQDRTSIDPRWKAIQADGSDFPGEDHPAMTALKTGKKVQNVVMGVFNPEKENYTWININATPQFRNGEKSPFQVYTTFEDITKRKIAEDELVNTNFWLEESQRVSELGSYVLDIPENKWTSSKIMDEIFGISDNYERDIEGWINIVHPEQKEEMLDYFQKDVIEKQIPFNKEYRIVRISDGEERWIHGLGELSFDENNNPVNMLGTIQDITERKKAGLELEKSQKELKKLTAHLHTVREEERTLVAHELHDDIGQALTALKIDMYMLEKKLPKDKKDISDQIKATKDLLDKTIQTTRKMYSQLRPTLIEHFSIKEVLEDQFETFKISNNISGGTDIDLEGTTLKEEEAITIYRIVQEALNNVKWHSQANTVNIGLKKLENHFKLTIEDDGIGIKDKDLNKSKSFGIIGMKERTSFLGGEIEFTGTPNKGTTITVTFPLNPENG